MDRFLAVHLHLRYQELVTHKRVVAMVITIWVTSALLPAIFATPWLSRYISFMFVACDGTLCRCYGTAELQDIIGRKTTYELRYHGRWILPKNAKNIFFAFRIEKT